MEYLGMSSYLQIFSLFLFNFMVGGRHPGPRGKTPGPGWTATLQRSSRLQEEIRQTTKSQRVDWRQ